jgi:uncharacterized protein YndB with AHSA1/START domain
MKLQMTQRIERPPADVFRFIATDHVRNHPRWDTKMNLEQLTDGPMGVGTVIRRRHTHPGYPVEGTMEVVEFEQDHAIGMVIRDGETEMRSRMTFEPEGEEATLITADLDVPSLAEPMDPGPIQQSLRRMKELIEFEYTDR